MPLSRAWRKQIGPPNTSAQPSTVGGYIAEVLWLLAEAQYNQIVTITMALQSVNDQLGMLMAAVQVEQGDLDTLATNLQNVETSLATEIQNLENNANIPAGSLDGLNQVLASFQSLASSVPQPAPTPTPPGPTPPTP